MQFTRLALACAIGVALTVPAIAADDIVVGMQTSLSGPISSIGIPLGKGVEAGHAVIGSIDGHKVHLVKLDDASDPSIASRNARKLAQEYSADVLIGAAGSPLTVAMAAVGHELKVPTIALSPISAPGEQGSWLIVVPQPAPLMVEADVEHMKKAGIKTVAYIGYSDAWGDLVYNALIKTAPKAGIEVVTNERYARSDTSVTAQVLKIIAAKPGAVLTGGSGTPGALPHITLKDRGYRGPVYSTHAVIGPDFIRVGGAAVNGTIAPTGPVIVAEQLPDSNPIKKVAMTYREAYFKLHGEKATDANSGYGYDGMLIFANAAKRALAKANPGTAEFREALRDALVSTKNLVGVHAVYNYTPGERYGADERARVMVQLKNGAWTLMP
jgi:branched-chain amino acid transport system substrate-binding protein